MSTDTIFDSVATIATLSAGAPVTGSVDAPGDRDWFSINLDPQQVYVFDLMGMDGVSDTGPDFSVTALDSASLSLYDSSGFQWAYDGAGAGSAMIQFVASAPGTYYVEVTGFSGAIGGYELAATAQTGGGQDNMPPQVAQGVADQTATSGSAFMYALMPGIFYDPEGQTLSYTATLADGSPLPAWLMFTGTQFAGTPTSADAGALNIRVTAYDSGSLSSVYDDFTLTVGTGGGMSNLPPQVAQGLADQTATSGSAFMYALTPGVFYDPEGQTLSYTAALADGSPLPSWLTFDGMQFGGTPTAGDAGSLNVRVTAYDAGSQASVYDDFSLIVGAGSGGGTPPADISADATTTASLAVGGAVLGAIDQAYDHDWYAIDLTAGQSYAFDLAGSGEGGVAALPDSYLILRDGEGGQLAANDDSAGTLNSHIDFTATLGGRYFVDAGAWSTNVGGYRLSASVAGGGAGNAVPLLNRPLPDQSAVAGNYFFGAFPYDSFIDAGDTLTYSATLADDAGSPLPDWLSFNGQHFTGVPAADAGQQTLSIRVTATDSAAQTVSDVFDLQIYGATQQVNLAPMLNFPLPNQIVREGNPFYMPVPAATFIDPENGALTYSASLSNGSALPSWLNFDPDYLLFSGSPQTGAAATLNIRVTATDSGDLSATTDFELEVVAADSVLNLAPTLNVPLADQSAVQGGYFSFAMPWGTFSDPENQPLSYEASLAGGGSLPDWLGFDAGSGQFYGIPDAADVGDLDIVLSAEDDGGSTASDTFRLSVQGLGGGGDDFGNDLGTAGYLGVGHYLTGVLDPVSDQDWVRVDLTGGVGYVFELQGQAVGETAAVVDTYLEVFDQSGVRLALNDDAGGDLGYGSRVFFDAPSGGAYYLLAHSYAYSSMGGFKLSARTRSAYDAGTAATESAGGLPAANQAPTVVGELPNGTATQGSPFEFHVPFGTFVDPEGGQLNYYATRADGSPLPAWLSFDPWARQFYGIPGGADVGTTSVRITAVDDRGASEDKTFSIAVSAAGAVQDDWGGDAATTGAVAAGEYATGRIDPADDRDWFAARLAANVTYVAELEGYEVGGAAALADPYLYLHDPSGMLLAANDDASGRNSRLSFTPSYAGEYFFAAGAYANAYTGGYRLVLRTEADYLAGTAAEVGGTTPSTNTAPVLTGAIADQTTLQDAYFTLGLPYGLFADNDVGDSLTLGATLADGGALPAWLSFDAQYGGFYGVAGAGDVGDLSVRVTATDGGGLSASTTFDISVESSTGPVDDFGNDPLTNGALGVGQHVFGIVETNSDADWFRIDLTGGHAYVFDLEGYAGDSGTPAVGDTFLELHDANGNLVASNDDSFGLNSRIFFAAPGNASYFLVAHTYGYYSSGGYRLTARTQEAFNEGAETEEAQASGGGEPGGENTAPSLTNALVDQSVAEDQFFNYSIPFNAFADPDLGDRLRFSARLADGGALPAWLRFDPFSRTFSGTPHTGDVGSIEIEVSATDRGGEVASDSFTLAVSGQADLRVETQASSVREGGDFVVTFTRTGPTADAASIDWSLYGVGVDGDDFAGGTPLAGTVAFGTSVASATLTLTTADDAAVEGDEWFQVYLSNPQGIDLAQPTIDGIIADNEFGSVAAGDDFGNDTLTNGNLAIGQFISGRLEEAGDLDWFRLPLAAGESYVFDLQGETGPGGESALADSYLYLYDADDNLVSYNDDGFGLNSRIFYTAPAGGSYYLAAGAYGNYQAGSYRLTARTQGQFDNDYAATASTGSAAATDNVNDAPRLMFPLSDQQADAGASYRFAIPAETFFDVDDHDTVTYSATLQDGSALPRWLSFDANLGVFSGTPGSGDAGSRTIRVTATDRAAATTTDEFELDVAATHIALTPLYAMQAEGQPFVFTLTRSGATDQPSSVDWQLTLDGGVDADDLAAETALTGTLSFARGVTAQSITIASVDDAVVENDESFSLLLSNPTNAALRSAYATAVVTNNDQAQVGAGDDFGDDSATNGALAVGSYVTGRLGTVGDHDWFRINLAGGASYVFDLEGFDLAGNDLAGLRDTYLDLYDAAGNRIASDDDGGDGLYSRLRSAIATTGTYYLGARAYADMEAGDFVLTARTAAAYDAGTAATPMGGDTVQIQQATFVSLETTAEGSFRAEGSSTSTPPGTTAFTFGIARSGDLSAATTVDWAVEIDPYMVFGVADAADFAGGLLPAGTATFSANQNKVTVTVNVVADQDEETSEAFTVRLNGVSSDAMIANDIASGVIQNDDLGSDDALGDVTTGRSLATNGSAATGVIEQLGDEDWFRIELSADADYVFDLVGAPVADSGAGAQGVGDTWLDLYDAGGRLLASDDDGGEGLFSRLEFTPEAAGTYYLSARTYPGALQGGGYRISAADQSAFASGATIGFAQTWLAELEGTDAGKATDVTLTVLRSGSLDGSSVLRWDYVRSYLGNAASSNDFDGAALPAGGILSFASGESAQTITVSIAADNLSTDAAQEYFHVALSDVRGGELDDAASFATVAITDDDETGSTSSIVPGGHLIDAFQPGDNSDPVVASGLGSGDYLFYVLTPGDVPAVAELGSAAAAGQGFAVYTLPGTSSSQNLSLALAQAPVGEPQPYVVGLQRADLDDYAANTGTRGRLLPTAAGQVVTGLLGDARDQDWFQIQLVDGHEYLFGVMGDVGVEFRDATGNVISRPLERVELNPFLNAADAPLLNTRAYALTADRSGTYYLSLHDGAAAARPYALLARDATAVAAMDVGRLSIVADSAYVLEGNDTAARAPLVFAVTRAGDLSEPATAFWRVVSDLNGDNRPDAGVADAADVASETFSSSVSFAAGQQQAFVTVLVKGDSLSEADELLAVDLYSATGAVIESGYGRAVSIIRQESGETAAPLRSITALAGYRDGGNNFVAGLPVGTEERFAVDEGTAAGGGTAAAVFSIRRSAAPSSATAVERVNWRVAGMGGIAAGADDFVGATSGVATFSSQQSEVFVTVTIAADAVDEENETFALALSLPASPVPATDLRIETAYSAVLMVRDDDSAALQAGSGFRVRQAVAAGASLADRAEDADGASLGYTPYSFSVERGAIGVASAVAWAVTGATGGAAADDFVGGALPGGRITFSAGQTVANLTVLVAADRRVEADEEFSVTLRQPQRANATGSLVADTLPGALAQATARGTIRNDDADTPTVQIAALNAARAEGTPTGTAAVSTPFTFLISRQGNLAAASTVDWRMVPGTTSTGQTTADQPNAGDFVGSFTDGIVAGRASFAAGQSAATLTILVRGDNDRDANEVDENFSIALTTGSNASIDGAMASAAGTILDDDGDVVSRPDLAGNSMTATSPAPRDIGGILPAQNYAFSDYIGNGAGSGFDDTEDWYRFSIGDLARLSTLRLSYSRDMAATGAAANPDLDLALYTSNGVLVTQAATSSQAAAGEESAGVAELAAGEYFVAVSGFRTDSAAAYTLALRTESIADRVGSTVAAATRLTLAGAAAVTTHEGLTRGDNDYYSFTLTQRGQLQARLDGLAGNADLRLLRVDTAGTTVLAESHLADKAAESLDLALAPGAYHLWVYSPENAASFYDLAVSATPILDDAPSWDTYAAALAATTAAEDWPTPVPAAMRPTLGSAAVTQRGSVNRLDTDDYWALRLDGTRNLVISMSRTGSGGNADLQLLNAAGMVIATGVEGANGAESIRVDELEQANYVLRVSQRASEAAPTQYSLNMSAARPARSDGAGDTKAAARNIGTLRGATQRFSDSLGYDRTGTTSRDGTDFYRFVAGPGGGRLSANLSGLSAAAYLRLWTAEGSTPLAASANTPAVDDEVLIHPDQAATSGFLTAGTTYYVSVDGPEDALTGYNLDLSLVPNDLGANTRAGASAAGSSDLGRIGIATAAGLTAATQVVTVDDFVGQEDSQDYWRFSTARISNLRINLAAQAGSTGDADIRLLDANGAVVASSAAAGAAAERISIDNLAAGTYFLNVALFEGSVNDQIYRLTLDAQKPNDQAGNVPTTAGSRNIMVNAQGRFQETISDWIGTVQYPTSTAPFTVSTTAAPRTITGTQAAGAVLAAGEVDQYDYYRVVLTRPSVVDFTLDQPAAQAVLAVGTAAGTQFQALAGETFPVTAGTSDQRASGVLAAGTYYVRVARVTDVPSVAYTLSASGRAQAPADGGGEQATPNATALAAARLPLGGAAATVDERLGSAQGTTATSTRADTADYYRFVVPTTQTWEVTAQLSGLEANADLAIVNAAGTVVQVNGADLRSAAAGTANESLVARLSAGTYLVRVDAASGTETPYSLSVAAAQADDRPDTYAQFAAWDMDTGDGSTPPEPDPSALAAPTGTTAVSVGGRIEVADDRDWVRLDGLVAGVSYVMRQDAAATAGLADPSIVGLYAVTGAGDPVRIPRAANDDSGNGRNSSIAFRPTVASSDSVRYYIEVGGANTSTGAYTLSMARANAAPTAANPIRNQVATEGQEFTLRLPWNLFTDQEGDNLALRATLQTARPATGQSYTLDSVYGRALPDWLSFDAAAQVFVGTPPVDAADVAVRIVGRDTGVDTTSDSNDGFAWTDFTIATPRSQDDFGDAIPAGSGRAPGALEVNRTARGSIEAAYDVDWFAVTLAGGASYQVDLAGAASQGGTLVDPALRGIYRLVNGRAQLLPNSANNDAPGTTDARVTLTVAADAGGTYYVAAGGTGEGMGSYTVGITRQADNRAPVVAGGGIPDATAREGQALRIEIPSAAFSDPDAGDHLGFSATLSNGNALPSWLSFNAGNRVFTGTPPANTNDTEIRVTARDERGLTVSDEFVIRTQTARTAGASTAAAANAPWTIMVYMAADNDLESYALKDVNEMEDAIRRNTGLRNVNIVVQLDRHASYSNSDGNWSDTRRGRLSADNDTNRITSTLATVGEKNMGDGGTLTEFVNWASSNYAADRYALMVWDHGGGLSGTCLDYTDGNASLSVVEMTQALAATNIGRVDMLGFDTCLQGMVEQAYDLRVGSGDSTRTLADYVVASQNLEPGDGWDYRRWLTRITASTDPRTLAVRAVDAYQAAWSNDSDRRPTLAAVDTANLDELVTAMRQFVDATNGDTPNVDDELSASERSAVLSSRSGASYFHADAYRDLGAFMRGIAAASSVDQNVRNRARAVVAALDEAVVARTTIVDGTSGLNVYVPGSRSASSAADYNGGSFRFVADSGWNEFLTALNG